MSNRRGAVTKLCNLHMNEAFFAELSAWLTQAGLAGTAETEIVSGFCDRCVAAGLPLGRAQVFIDTLHPVHEGRLFRWGHDPTESPLVEYGRTSPDVLAASGSELFTLDPDA
jgi:adenylate cyclase